ncbi:hypothetical protein [Pseudonocardia parietis]|uniref:Uncharacterized protein n=1 Tax=Pseudonocardia parietis TaxID=570936 RepID=A0ABS4W635_9PSEU|nr:hypothetical protein [Pseudonocardia parietis]MBP2371674.1 hypothetical protein [Pseudonocardia parietis]
MSRPAALVEVTELWWRDRITERRAELAAGPPTAGFVPTSRPADAD